MRTQHGAPKPYEFTGFGDVHGPKAYEFTGFGDIHGPKAYKFIGFGNLDVKADPKTGPGRPARGPEALLSNRR